MKKLLILLGMGGHTSQILKLVDSLGPKYKYDYIIGDDDQTSSKKIKFKGKIYKMFNPRKMNDNSLFIVFLKMFPAIIDAFRILLKSKPKVVISAGPSMTIPLFWAAKIMGIKTIFVESWVRVHHGSETGKFVYPISNLFLIQWETMKKVYPKSIYVGRLS